MKSIKELYETYPFEVAKKELIALIEESFQDRKESVEIPQITLKCFSLNLKQSKEFFSELENKGYRLIFNNDKITISFTNTSHEELVNSLNKDSFDRVLDEKNFIDYTLELIEKHPSNWKKPTGPMVPASMKRESYSYRTISVNGGSSFINIYLDKNYIRYNDFYIFINSKQVYLLKQKLESKDLLDPKTNITYKKNRVAVTHSVEEILISALKEELAS